LEKIANNIDFNLFTFKDKKQLAMLKSRHEDITYFVAAYLNHRSGIENILTSPTIKIKHAIKDEDIDIFIKDLNCGIECKNI